MLYSLIIIICTIFILILSCFKSFSASLQPNADNFFLRVVYTFSILPFVRVLQAGQQIKH